MFQKSILIDFKRPGSNNSISMFSPHIVVDPYNIISALENFYSKFHLPNNSDYKYNIVQNIKTQTPKIKAFLFTSNKFNLIFNAMEIISILNKSFYSQIINLKLFFPWDFINNDFDEISENFFSFKVNKKTITFQDWTPVSTDCSVKKAFNTIDKQNSSLLLKNNYDNTKLLIIRSSSHIINANIPNRSQQDNNFKIPGLKVIIGYIAENDSNIPRALKAHSLTPALLIKELAKITNTDFNDELLTKKQRHALFKKNREISQKLKNIPILIFLENPAEYHILLKELSMYKKTGLNLIIAEVTETYKF
jgi:hypothetical protein